MASRNIVCNICKANSFLVPLAYNCFFAVSAALCPKNACVTVKTLFLAYQIKPGTFNLTLVK